MPNNQIPLRVYGLFMEGHPELMNRVPSDVIEQASYSFKKEKALALKRSQFYSHRSSIMTSISKMDNPISRSGRIKVYPMIRNELEHIGDYIQIIGAACIHDDKRILLLQLEQDGGADGYHRGILTYPQGHCIYDDQIDKFQRTDNGSITYELLAKIVKENIFREIQEELTIEGEYNRVRFLNDVRNALTQSPNNGKLYPLYVDRAGTSCRHLCILADIYMDMHSCFNEVADLIISNEPTKHSVKLTSFNDLLQLKSIDDICIWVARSFSMLPFMSLSFIQDYLKKTAN